MKSSKWLAAATVFVVGSAVAQLAFAHAVVSPKQVGVGAFQTFSLGVPSEGDAATTAIRLLIPDGLQHVTPNVKPGWQIAEKVTGDAGEDAVVTEISWTGGSIPAGQRDEFVFSAQAPVQERQLPWKVYQTYQDGHVVSWDQAPGATMAKDSEGNDDFSKAGPYSQTDVVNDLNPAPAPEPAASPKASNIPLILSLVALALSVIALSRSHKGKA